MTREEKILKLQTLFKQKEEIDNAILAVIDDKETNSAKRGYQKKSAFAGLVKSNKVIRRGSKADRENRYYCLDCKHVFASKATKLDAVCPECNSVHIVYASNYKK